MMGTEDMVAGVAIVVAVGFFSGAIVNAHWESKIHKAPLQCRVELLEDRNSELIVDQPTSPGSGR